MMSIGGRREALGVVGASVVAMLVLSQGCVYEYEPPVLIEKGNAPQDDDTEKRTKARKTSARATQDEPDATANPPAVHEQEPEAEPAPGSKRDIGGVQLDEDITQTDEQGDAARRPAPASPTP